MASKFKRNDLPLATKYKVIQEAQKSKGVGIRKLAEKFGCDKSQICTILKNKEKIGELYFSNASSEQCRTGKDFVSPSTLSSMKLVFVSCAKKGLCGSILAERAMEIAQLNLGDFKTSNGLLDCWKNKHNQRQMNVCSQSSSVSNVTVDS